MSIKPKKSIKDTGRRDPKSIVYVWTDGACSNNGKRNAVGGWACHLQTELNDGSIHSKQFSGRKKGATNNQMELMAVAVALNKLRYPSKVMITTDSKYVKDGITKWIRNWQRNGWKTKDGKSVKNRDLWERIWELKQRHEVAFHWTKGHANDEMNNLVDELARKARDGEEVKA